jgi:hypothetical protein
LFRKAQIHQLRSLAPQLALASGDLSNVVSIIKAAGKGGLLVITGSFCRFDTWTPRDYPGAFAAYVHFNAPGAGVSTESGIPDYRSPNGSYSRGHKPMTHQEFMGSDSLRKRFWARNVVCNSTYNYDWCMTKLIV